MPSILQYYIPGACFLFVFQLTISKKLSGFAFNVDSLSFKGHEFLDNIKDDTVWKKAKKFVGEHLTSTSFSIIANVASKIAIEALASGATPK